MEPNTALNHAPINFFARGADYISDKFDMTMIDTSNANAFEEFEFVSAAPPDMMQNYVNADKSMEPDAQKEKSGGILSSIMNFFSAPAQEEVPQDM